jgi:hypothetical protein
MVISPSNRRLACGNMEVISDRSERVDKLHISGMTLNWIVQRYQMEVEYFEALLPCGYSACNLRSRLKTGLTVVYEHLIWI